ncbi:MAG TPA: hypothetical protein VKZ46_03700 [Pedomonas sp.]|nr:hypothetical protein [Pedomonas sp.]
MSTFWSYMLAIAVLASFLLVGFGIRLAVRETGRERLRGILMVIAGAVLLGNVYLYTTLPELPERPAAEAENG